MNIDESIYEKENYWRDGKEGEGHGEWEPHAALFYFLRKKFQIERILDIGCGPGDFIRHGVLGNAYGLDFSKFAAKNPLPGAEGKIIRGNACDIPFKDNFFDVVTAFNMMEHLRPENVDAALNEIFRVSKRWVILMTCVSTDYNPPLEYDYSPEFGRAFTEYTERTREEIKRGHWCVHPREWWIKQIGQRGTVDLAQEKEVLGFTSLLVPDTDHSWSKNCQGLTIIRKTGV